MKEHTQEHIESLLELNKVLATRSLSFLERSAAERSVQVVVEACIGLSKHVCKKAEKQVLGDANMCAQKALSLLPEQPIKPETLKGAIGMRNAIVHDYLDLDWELVQGVIKQKAFLELRSFIHAAADYLNQ